MHVSPCCAGIVGDRSKLVAASDPRIVEFCQPTAPRTAFAEEIADFMLNSSPTRLQRMANAGLMTHEQARTAAEDYVSTRFVTGSSSPAFPAESIDNVADVPYKYLLKLLLIGDSGVGKSSVLLRFAQDDFLLGIKSTIGVEFNSRCVTVDGDPVMLQIWDTAGVERFRGLTAGYYRGAMGVMIVYDVTSRKSFDNVAHRWVRDAQQHASEDAILMLVGHKTDISEKREVTFAEGAALARTLAIALFLEASALHDEFITSAFFCLTTEILQRIKTTRNGANAVATHEQPH
eukprot:TRINITY_DN4961_c0_g2_i2.p1 TRINITY_DN4961_c0_g2~~TRINITY_DN4961_c0_g2_i2.p1  ORF type:complete len:290 (-),score=12.41 TRINITY_DN4961_c0_g2_i2:96-965(-)